MLRVCTVLALLALLHGPAQATETRFAAQAGQGAELVIESTTDLAALTPLLNAFMQANPGVAITYNELTTNEVFARMLAACANGDFIADVVISSSVDQQVRLVNDGCARPLGAAAGSDLPAWARWREELVGLTFEPAVMVYNRDLIPADEVPQSRFELIDQMRDSDIYRAKIGTYDIESSGVGYLFAFQDAIAANTWGRLVEGLGRNEVQLFCCSGEIIDRVADGRLLVGYNVLGSYALAQAAKNPHLGVILPADYTLVLSRAALIPASARRVELARAFIAFARSVEGQRSLAGDAMLLSPARGASELQALLGASDEVRQALRPIALSPALLVGLDDAKRKLFLHQWRRAIAPVAARADLTPLPAPDAPQ